MKLFTKELYLALQNCASSDVQEKAQREWSKRWKGWQSHVEANLDESTRSLANRFHDAKIREVHSEGDCVELILDCSTAVKTGGRVKVRFEGVSMQEGVASIAEKWWLFEEIYPLKNKGNVIMILSSDDGVELSEASMEFKRVSIE